MNTNDFVLNAEETASAGDGGIQPRSSSPVLPIITTSSTPCWYALGSIIAGTAMTPASNSTEYDCHP